MALSYKARRALSLILLLLWLPIYIVIVVSIINVLGPLNGFLQFLLYVFLGIAWVLPFKSIFRGIGKEDPDT